jgi:hypothetical protein
VLSSLAVDRSNIRIDIQLQRAEDWEHQDDSSNEGAAVAVRSQEDLAQFQVTFSPQMNSLLEQANNAGEREMMKEVLRGLRDLVRGDARELLSDTKIESILDRHAPLGVKKKLLFFDARSVPEIDRSGLPKYRSLQKADENELLDELGDYLTRVEDFDVGPIPDEQRTVVLSKVVSFFYEELKRIVSTLSPDGLLEWLIAHQEAAIRESAFHQLTIPTRLACFSSEARMIEELRKETPRHNSTLVAARFVIEYVSAQPPVGLRPISKSVYDRLQALAWHVVNFGFESDLIHFQLADYKMEILPTGRLGADRERYDKAHAAYMPKVMRGDISRSTRFFDQLWTDSRPGDASADGDLASLDTATVAEFRFSFSEMLDFTVAAIGIGNAEDPTVACLAREQFLDRMARELDWEIDKVARSLDLFSLSPRKDFLNPDPPHKKEDVYPWRYNRSLSYLRRPFVIRLRSDDQEKDTEVLCGTRNLNSFWKNLATLCHNGRLSARARDD